MSASFEEKSVWIQLVSTLVVLGAYFVVAGLMIARGITALPAFVPLFTCAVIVLVGLLVAGHVIAAMVSRHEDADERDRLYEWRAESRSGWLLATGVLAAITGMIVSIEPVWIVHVLLLSLLLSTLLSFALRLVDYRRSA